MLLRTAETLTPELQPVKTEQLVELPDRCVLVILVNHGVGSQPFPGTLVAREELERFKEFGPLTALAADGLFPLNTQEGMEVISRALTTPGRPDFASWVIQQAVTRNAALIIADPVGFSPGIDILTDSELANTDQLSGIYLEICDCQKELERTMNNPRYRRTLERESALLEQVLRASQIAPLLNNVLTTILLSSQITTANNCFDRRRFLKIVGGLMGASFFGFAVGEITAFAGRQEVAWLIKRGNKKLRTVLREINPQLMTKIEASWQLRLEDMREVDKIFEKIGPLTDEDRKSEAFLRRSEFLVNLLTVTLLFRNAVVAEILSLPLDQIIPAHLADLNQKGEKANIAAIFGFDHGVLPQSFTISSLLIDYDFRREIIRKIAQAIKDIFPSDLGIDRQESFPSSSTTHFIDLEPGELYTQIFSIPFFASAFN